MTDAPGAATFRSPADAYDRHVGRYADALAAEMLAVAEIAPGQRALDVGCGPGALTRALAGRLGADSVSAVDPSPPFVEACRLRVPGADVRLGAAEALPFDGGRFERVVSQLVVSFMADAVGGVGEMRRVAAPGGLVASAVWDYADGMTLLRRFWDAALRVDPAGAPAHDEGRVMPFCTPPELERLWRDAGLDDVATGALTVGARYADFDDLWEPFEGGVAPSGAYTASLDRRRRAALRTELRRSRGEPAGPFALTARAWWVAGRAPRARG
ncbi:MAG TPA: class I SAM-dependent methyltransferase [Solirubrobacteraceae bacterium]|nr:class I SAM-dependent methyltransferase [Solirubrobacteraceae bacterium]